MEQSSVGGETQAFCTTCKTMREHVIVAMVGDRPAKVECTECHKQHLFRAGPPGAKSGAARSKTRKSPEPIKAAPPIDLAARIAGRDPRSYDPKVGFLVGDVVRHPSFGVGVVTALAGAQKMEVAFEVGAKLLAHDRAAAIAPTLTRPTRRDDDERVLATDAPPVRPARTHHTP